MRATRSLLLGVALAAVVPVLLPGAVAAQAGGGVELRAYPAGIIGTVRAQWRVAERVEVEAGAGYNATDRRAWGEHGNEEGGGPGVGVGVNVTPSGGAAGWIWGVRAELWALDIDWSESDGRTGSTDVRVVQPTGLVGYRWPWPTTGGHIDATAALGFEINTRTRGEAVGDGPILLLGFAVTLGR